MRGYEKQAAFLDTAIKAHGGLTKRSNVTLLDIGTGDGALVRALLALDYDAYGCDLKPRWESVPNVDGERFSTISWMPYRLPYPDEAFDVVVSTSVLEHAQNKEELFREILRVLRLGGVSMHLFPSKWFLPYEPHIRVPMVNFFWPRCPAWWIQIWAVLGVRNEFQRNQSWKEVSEANRRYCMNGLAYLPNSAYRDLCFKIFGNFSAPMEFYVRYAYGNLPRLLRRLPFRHFTGWMAGALRTYFIVVRRTA